jgi:2-methylisocitrate lyase-like PEP mutase family enzyme
VAEGSIEEVIRRGKLYRDAGADIVFPEGLLSIEEIKRCGDEIGGPILYNMTGISPVVTREDLARMNVAVVFAGNALRASLVAMIENFRRLHDEGYAYLKHAPNLNLHEFAGFPEVMQWENEFLPPETQEARYIDSLGFAPQPR